LLVAEFAEVHDLADRRAFGRGNLDQVEIGLSGQLKCLACRDDAQLFPLHADQANGADPDLLIDSLTSIMRVAVADTITSLIIVRNNVHVAAQSHGSMMFGRHALCQGGSANSSSSGFQHVLPVNTDPCPGFLVQHNLP